MFELSPDELIATHVPTVQPINDRASNKFENIFQDFMNESGLNTSPTFNYSEGSDYDYQTDSEWYRHSFSVTVLLCVAYFVVFALGIFGNSFVVSVVLRSPRMRTVTNFFIVNLAVADILVLIFCLPATLLGNIIYPWVLGSFMCKSVSYLQGVSVSASINTLVAISIDRFLAICFPLKCQMTTSIARKIIGIIWIFSMFITIPWGLYFELVQVHPTDEALYCVERWPHQSSEKMYFFVANLGLCYVLPLSVITACYVGIWIKVRRRNIPGETRGTNADAVIQKSKIKVVKMMVIVVATFALSWLPLYIIFTMVKSGVTLEENSWSEEIFAVMIPIAQWLGSLNSSTNPILYTFCNKKFRKGFLAIIKSRSCCGTLRYEQAKKGTKSTYVMRSTFKSKNETHSEYVNSAQV
ncbi:hypothetical protein JTE90_022365 [Oedothorax gibbosus]|uniref:G-protein coupled receptors family 1 profile domain-containing protein n=1 Tax=Oedothorax gibbosus TaxID=931172 RepID=A0AAV6UMA1_9ARAC|nr:hypothetical protein JTE90_022365 [Oedothorax gibbosus]